MTEDDKKAFAETWRAALATYGREATREMLAIAFGVLKRFTIEQVLDGVGEHMTRSKFAPTPADIVSAIEAMNPDGRPDADEAWAIAITAEDEDETVVWTADIAGAFAAAKPVLEAGDKVGARMAFRTAYERIVAESRRNAVPAKWEVSIGFDASRREAALMSAVARGALAAPQVQRYLPLATAEEGAAIAGLLTGKVVETSNKSFNERISELRKMLKEGQEESERERVAKIEAKLAKDREQKEAVAKAVEQWQKETA